VAGPCLSSATPTPCTTVYVSPMEEIFTLATAVPLAGSGPAGAVGAVVLVELIELVDDGGAVVEGGAVVGDTVVVPANSLANWWSSVCWACAVWMPVPHSWYATNANISRPSVMSVRPTSATFQRQSWGGAGRSK
jgi:hypothetical protein